MIIAVWIEFIDIVKTLRHLVITGHSLWPQCTRHCTHFVSLKKLEGILAFILHPNFQLAIILK